MSTVEKLLLLWLLLMNASAFIMMGADKALSKTRARRIPEATLITAAVLGGSPGAILGMYLFRHKTRHRKFSVGLPVILTLQLVSYVAARYLL